MSKILYLPVKKQWFDMECAGLKTEDYRAITPYWMRRLLNLDYLAVMDETGHPVFKKFSKVELRNGYGKNVPSAQFECLGINIGYGNCNWGATIGEQYFIIKLGRKLNEKAKS